MFCPHFLNRLFSSTITIINRVCVRAVKKRKLWLFGFAAKGENEDTARRWHRALRLQLTRFSGSSRACTGTSLFPVLLVFLPLCLLVTSCFLFFCLFSPSSKAGFLFCFMLSGDAKMLGVYPCLFSHRFSWPLLPG